MAEFSAKKLKRGPKKCPWPEKIVVSKIADNSFETADFKRKNGKQILV
jgi:hypothetical protein